MPYRKRRKWRIFKKRVRKAMAQRVHPNVVFSTQSTTQSIGTTGSGANITFTTGNQCVLGNDAAWGCWGGEQATGVTQDIGFIVNNLNKIQTNFNAAPLGIITEAIQFRSVYLSHVEHHLTLQADTERTLMADLYTCVANQNIADSNYANPYITWLTLIGSDQQLGGAAVSEATKGMTPLQSPGFGKWWKIVSKERIQIGPHTGDPASATRHFSMRCKKGIYNAAKAKDLYALKGRTMYWLLIIDPQNMANFIASDGVAFFRIHKVHHWKPLRTQEIGGAGGTAFTEQVTITPPTT